MTETYTRPDRRAKGSKMAKFSKAVDPSKASDMAFTLLNVLQEPAVQKTWKEAGCSTHAAFRETREAWKRHK
jgi:hypothetical protein